MKKVDLLIIGGGITGAGCLLEGASRGLKCVLLEKGDFSSGTTQASSRLIHGGIRYLENFHFNLVSESLRERFWISQRFPHLLKPLPIHIPVYGWGKRSPLVAGIGVKLYDLLAGRMKITDSSIYFRESARKIVPEISPDGLSGLFVFNDYQILMPERLVLESILAAESMGAESFNYTAVSEIRATRDGYAVKAKDRFTGEDTSFGASAVINAAGSWIDEIRGMAGFRGKLLRPTKGVHIEVQKVTDRALFVEAGTDRRLFFILPFMNHTLIGTTDTDFTGSPDDVCPLPEDVSYLTDNANRIFRDIKLDPEKIYSAYGGLRPLISVHGRAESEVPRKHRVVCEGHGKRFISITGGKLTTYRKMAEDTVKRALRVLGKGKKGDRYPITYPCGKTDPANRDKFVDYLSGEYGIEKESAKVLFSVHGMGAERLLEAAGNDTFLKSPFSQYTHEIPAQIIYGYEKESAILLEDILLRRMLLGKSPSKGLDGEHIIKEVLIRYLGRTHGEANNLFDEARYSINKRFMMNLQEKKRY